MFLLCSHRRAITGGKFFTESLGQRRQDGHCIADDAVGGEIEYRCIGIVVDRHDHVRGIHADAVLYRARNAGGNVQFGTHGLAGLSDLALRVDPALEELVRRYWSGGERSGQESLRKEIAWRLAVSGALEETQDRARRMAKLAVAELECFPPGPWREELRKLTARAADRVA